MRDSICHFPARPLSPDEHALVAEWLSAAGDIVTAYVSSRSHDDPAHYRRIVIVITCVRVLPNVRSPSENC